tara:strand:- start:1720 stop:2265 length:546 start_codon:yes stop_codon:yes gene_type:complete
MKNILKIKNIVFEESIELINIKINKKLVLNKIKKTPGNSIMDEVRGIFKTDIYVTDYSQKIYGQDFFQAVKDAVKQFVKTKNHSELRISNYCFIRMKGDDQIGFHSSFESNFVGIYLLESGDKKEHICFYDNSKTKEVKVKLKEGDLLLLPSYLLRKFPNLKSKKTYTFVLFDFHIDTPRI